MASLDTSALLDDLDFQMLHAYWDYCSTALDIWGNFAGNEGQLTIVHNHILLAVESHCIDAKEKWPYGKNPIDLRDELYFAFDPEVMGRAFSDTIEDCCGQLQEIWLEAEGAEVEHDYIIASYGGDSFGPHSTEARWN